MSLPLHPAPAPRPDAEAVPVNLFTAGATIVLVAPLPGVMAEHVQLEVAGHQLRLRAERGVDGDHDYLLHEWQPTAFERTVDLPDEAGWPVTASLAHGLLTVTLARAGATTADDQPLVIAPGPDRGPSATDQLGVIDLRDAGPNP